MIWARHEVAQNLGTMDCRMRWCVCWISLVEWMDSCLVGWVIWVRLRPHSLVNNGGGVVMPGYWHVCWYGWVVEWWLHMSECVWMVGLLGYGCIWCTYTRFWYVGCAAGTAPSDEESEDWMQDGMDGIEVAEYVEQLEADGVEDLPVVRGRLKGSLDTWRGFTSSTFVLSVIEHGYQLHWANGPPPRCEKANGDGCYGENEDFVTLAVKKLVKQGAVEKCKREDIWCVLALNVHTNAAKERRLIVDGRPVNKYEVKRTFKFEALGKEGRDVFAGCSHGGSIDISHAYHHVEMHPDSRKFLGFEWRGEHYMFYVLPFGLQSAPWAFCTVVAEVVAVFRARGIRMVSYVDDFPHAGRAASESLDNAKFMIDFLQKVGFVMNPAKKCVGYDVALTAFTALGFVIDLEQQKFLMKPVRVEKILSLAEELWDRRNQMLPAKLVAALPGQLVSSSLALGGVARMMTRSLYAAIGSRRDRKAWNEKMWLTDAAKKEIQFWMENLREYDGMPIVENRRAAVVDITAYSDAGESGIGGLVRLGDRCGWQKTGEVVDRARGMCANDELKEGMESLLKRPLQFRGELTVAQSQKSSTWREGWAVLKLLEFAAPMMHGCRVRMHVDNISLAFGLGGVVRGFEEGVYGGSRKADIQELIVCIVMLCVKHHITLDVLWIPREVNTQADYLSKLSEHYDFKLDIFAFRKLNAAWGPYTIDRFSSSGSVLVESGRFNSKFWQPEDSGCVGIDAFWQSWTGEVNWVHPPYRLLGKVIRHMCACGAVGTLVIPWWEKAAWWPLVRVQTEWASWVTGKWRLGASVLYYNGGRLRGVLEPAHGQGLEEMPVAELWALKFDCSRGVACRCKKEGCGGCSQIDTAGEADAAVQDGGEKEEGSASCSSAGCTGRR